jgi:hypothetical protein
VPWHRYCIIHYCINEFVVLYEIAIIKNMDKRTKIVKYFKELMIGSLLFSVATNVLALPSVSGALDMSGSFYAIDASGAKTSDANNAIAIDFDFFGMNKFRITSADGDFTGLETVSGDISTLGDIKDFQFDSLPSAIADFWVVDMFSFELTDVMRTNSSSSFIDLVGKGIITATGFADTEATWKFSGNTTGAGVFSWSASSEEVTSVPEPSMLALLSIGLIALGLRKKI